MDIYIFIGIILILFALQFTLSTKVNNVFIEYLPISIIIIGLIFCLAAYIGAFGTNSLSVVAENQYFAMFLSVPLIASLIGSLIGILFYKLLKKKN